MQMGLFFGVFVLWSDLISVYLYLLWLFQEEEQRRAEEERRRAEEERRRAAAAAAAAAQDAQVSRFIQICVNTVGCDGSEFVTFSS